MFIEAGVSKTTNSLKQVFQKIDAQSCPYIYNFHLHTVCSDGQLPPEAVTQQAIQHGLNDFSITDHHTVNGYNIARQYLEEWRVQNSTPLPYPRLWAGVEITAELLEVEVHILGYGFDPDHPTLQPYFQEYSVSGAIRQADQVIAALHRAGGLAILAHPARYKRSAADLILASAQLGIDGIETYYCYGNNDPWQSSPEQTELLEELGHVYSLLQSCGTDTHGLDICKRR